MVESAGRDGSGFPFFRIYAKEGSALDCYGRWDICPFLLGFLFFCTFFRRFS